MSQGFEIVYEQGACLVVSKPGGTLTQAPPTIDSLESRVRRFLQAREQRTGNIYLAVTHRLDRPVSGLVVLARNVRAARRICKQFERRTVKKTYWALVEGPITPPAGTWEDYMRKVPDEPRAELLPADHPEARHALLHYRVLRTSSDSSLLEIELETGRMHQIRIQCASRGHAILGDTQYGASRVFGPQTEDWRARWIALHARQIVFEHPMTHEVVDVVGALPREWNLTTDAESTE